MMQLSKKERSELDALSKDVFGSSSRWQKMIDDGFKELLTEEVTETVPSEKEGVEPTQRQVRKPILKNGSQQYVMKYHTVESIQAYMLLARTQLQTIREAIKKQQDEQKGKEETEKRAKMLHEELSGSAK